VRGGLGARKSCLATRSHVINQKKIKVNGINLCFDTEGAFLRTSGNTTREVPTVILLHGGPGADHSGYKPDFTALTDVAQVIYLDHSGNGRSNDGPPQLWTLAQWADDLVAFCDALGVVKPVVYSARLAA
jgi:pimeloyl-ACP methyl ester carboxylesterase